jgi:hypothetical protein
MDPRVLPSGSRPWFAVARETLSGTTARESGMAQRRRAAKRAARAHRR